MEKISLILTIAVLLEALVEYCKTVYKTFENGEIKLGITQAVTVIAGIGFAYLFGLKLFETLGIEVNQYADMILTGVVISRGSNYASDLIKRLNGGYAAEVAQN